MTEDTAGSRISLELLGLFVEVVERQSISAAARAWQIAPSLAARKIGRLEAELDTRLFDRTTRRIHLTEAGVLTLAWARDVLAHHDRLTDDIDALQGQLAGNLRLVMSEYVSTILTPAFLAAFSRRYPRIRFSIAIMDDIVGIEKRDYDVAIQSGRLPDSTLKGVRIRDYRRVLCAAPSYLARRGKPTSIESLIEHDCLTHQQAIDGYWTFRKGTDVIRQRVHQLLFSNSYLPLIALARHGMGIIQASTGSVRDAVKNGELVCLLDEYECVNSDGSSLATWLLYPGGRVSARTRIFISELTAYIRDLPK
ncbi:LysR family transcriptional regulator [Pigmentiphaga litoralis]|uniref:DNA-binding transcriptional LysR family regulator n=1 Tax=Pigmentiphaga litoralis TaxID=516702 RepID=A0A7Y9LJ27_9BURK|nr:LysR family transcriptional regulator [Pigmentiphaga litoralis]NYE24832.1 DNA-binding transcriptional LysR family regulator [Pigmentiphaga litoralis]NYE81554.1 DNA-binding transcriptional LysR family regulator [Pigmentiphaga litoralis]